MDLNLLEQNIEYKFHDINLLKTALTHKSYANENKVASNEKLEFLGDSILEFVVSDYLYKNYTNLQEGEMTKLRATVVCENSLYNIAVRHKFSEFLYLGKSETKSNGKNKPAILADSVEAMIAGIYLDSNLKEAEKFIINNLRDSIKLASTQVGMKDYKTVLQEKLQESGIVKIEYVIINEIGPDHDKKFIAEVKKDGVVLAKGEGSSKKAAEMNAARIALLRYDNK